MNQGGTPGPKYNLENLTRNGLMKPVGGSMGIKTNLSTDNSKQGGTPGPKYNVENVTRNGVMKPIGWAFGTKRKFRVPFTPGPYAIGAPEITKNQAPAFSIRMKLGEPKKSCPTPGSNVYMLGTTVGNQMPDMRSAPMYSISGRSDGPAGRQDRATPGPANYAAVDLGQTTRQAPRPVILGRCDVRNRGHQTPAPNTYFPGPGGSQYANAPAAIIFGRHKYQSRPFLTAADRCPD